MGSWIKAAIAIVCLLAGAFFSVCAYTENWPGLVLVHNTIEDADCSFTFDNGWTWHVALRRNETKWQFFPLGAPDTVRLVCQTAVRKIEQASTVACGGKINGEFSIVEPNEGNFEAFCVSP